MVPQDPGAPDIARIALWLAAIFATALVSILGIIASAVLREKNKPAPVATQTQTPWEQERSGVLQRISTLESEVKGLRSDRHSESNRVQDLLAKHSLLEREDQHLKEGIEGLCERIDRLGG